MKKTKNNNIYLYIGASQQDEQAYEGEGKAGGGKKLICSNKRMLIMVFNIRLAFEDFVQNNGPQQLPYWILEFPEGRNNFFWKISWKKDMPRGQMWQTNIDLYFY